jgi:hypothetical protein
VYVNDLEKDGEASWPVIAVPVVKISGTLNFRS